MKSLVTMLLLAASLLTGCGKSPQDKVAEEQLKAIENQKIIVDSLKNAAQQAMSEAELHKDDKMVIQKKSK